MYSTKLALATLSKSFVDQNKKYIILHLPRFSLSETFQF